MVKPDSKIKILGISTSPRHANTELAVKEALKTAEASGYVETEYLSFAKYKLVPCNGCMKCFGWFHPADDVDGGLACYEFNDDSVIINRKLLECDGLIFGTPVYVLGVNSLARIFMEKTGCFGPNAFTRYSGALRYRPVGVIVVGGADSGGQELVGEDIWAWAIAIGMLPLGSWPTREDSVPQNSSHGAFPTTCDARSVYAKDGITKEATRTVPPTQGSRNMRAVRNVGRHTAYAAMMTKMGKESFTSSGLKEPDIISFTRYSVKPKAGSWVQKLIDEGKVEYAPKK